MNPAWKYSASTQPIIATTFFSPVQYQEELKTLVVFCPKQSYIIYSAGLNPCLPAFVLSETQLKSTLRLTEQRQPQNTHSNLYVVTPGVKCLQTARAIRGWTHPVSQLEQPVRNHHGLMNTVQRKRQEAASQFSSRNELIALIFFLFFVLF